MPISPHRTPGSAALLVLATAVLAGCSVDVHGLGGVVDSGPPCPLTEERCNGLDDDCDGMVDEGFDLLRDALNCGTCGFVCPEDPDHAAPICVAGTCEVSCDLGWLDCVAGMPGCETSISDPRHCGRCGNPCGGLVCDGSPTTTYMCSETCTEGRTLCSSSCVDVATDTAHCGGCDNVCASPPHASGICLASTCDLSCDSGYADCDARPTNGCEQSLATVASCGMCDVACAPDHAIGTCTTGTCAVARCDSGWGDCDDMTSNGCETSLTTSSNCGGCGVACSGATPLCNTVGGMRACSATCPSGLDLCSGGCVDTDTDAAHCGRCGTACAAAERCVDGNCRSPIIDVSAGGSHTCAVRATGEVLCWGSNANGRLGDGTKTTRNTPVTVAMLTGAVQVSAGVDHTCAVRRTGEVLCWGRNNRSQTSGTAGEYVEPHAVTGLTDGVEVAAGAEHTCALRSSGIVACWGRNDQEQLGDGSATSGHSAPVDVPGITDAVQITVGDKHSCARTRSGQVLCWGLNDHHQLGPDPMPGRPAVVTGISGAIDVTAGESHTCAVLTGGTVQCWGFNSEGQLGDDSTSERTDPVIVEGLTAAVQVAGGGLHTCARRGRVPWCWGRGDEGQLGYGSTTDRHTAIMVSGLSDAIDIDAGDKHTCAVVATGGVVCWGENATGRLGDGTTTRRSSPTPVADLP